LLRAKRGTKSKVIKPASCFIDSEDVVDLDQMDADTERLLEEVCSGVKTGRFKKQDNKDLPDDVKTILHAAYFDRMDDYLGPDYLKVLQSSRNLTKKAMVDSMTEYLLGVNELLMSPAERIKLSPLIKLLIKRHGSIEEMIYEVPDNTRISQETYDAFVNYGDTIGINRVVPRYKQKFRNMTKKDFVNIFALKFIYDSMRSVKLQKQGKTIIVITQDLEKSLFLCDRIVLMHQGSIVKIGSPKEVFTKQVLTKTRLLPLPVFNILPYVSDKALDSEEEFVKEVKRIW